MAQFNPPCKYLSYHPDRKMHRKCLLLKSLNSELTKNNWNCVFYIALKSGMDPNMFGKFEVRFFWKKFGNFRGFRVSMFDLFQIKNLVYRFEIFSSIHYSKTWTSFFPVVLNLNLANLVSSTRHSFCTAGQKWKNSTKNIGNNADKGGGTNFILGRPMLDTIFFKFFLKE